MVTHYTRGAEQERLARTAIATHGNVWRARQDSNLRPQA